MTQLLRFSLLMFIVAGLFAADLQAQTTPKYDEMRSLLKRDFMSISFLHQSEFNFSLDDDNYNGGRGFDLGAQRLDVRGQLDSQFLYRFQLEFRNSPTILDAQLGYRVSPDFHVMFGAFKPFVSIDLDPNPGATDFINRARLVGTMMNSREIGITALGSPGNWNYRFGVYNGTGLTRDNDNRFMYTGRLAYHVPVEDGRLNVGVSGFLNQTENARVGRSGLTSEGDRYLYGGFVQFDRGMFISSFELLQTRFDAVELSGDEETITSFFITLGLQVTDNTQLLVRWDYLDYDLTDRQSDLFILGWNYQATRTFSFQVNASAEFNEFGDNFSGISGLMQFQF
ncbi:Phosphate-selective porin O and P [Cyclonatronum proteinivorum]|uniref:Phosphate-selective porin O and P n=1 Tax=Cyclonatronum proteinivorum TaxID=1457365 RepID=A0A345UP83_9BACT|nr:porin [Cyclonatronum proteinivorum]AXJ02285.1 Phosphate-selective porin O and P [Cyclonatronum proteinivorum]